MDYKEYRDNIDPEIIERAYRHRIEQACLMDDRFYRTCMPEQSEAIELILQLILDQPDLKIIDLSIQDDIMNEPRRNICIDTFARNEKTGEMYDIEIQKTNDNIRKRARYHASILDARKGLKHGEDFKDLKDSIVIFICSDDILKKEKAIYRITRKTEDNIPFEDGSMIIILNCSFKGEHPLKELIEDLNQNDTDKMHYKELARVVKAGKGKFREEKTMDVFDEVYEFGIEKGIQKGIEQGIEKGIEQGIEKGSLDSKLETARKMLSGGKIPLSDIAAYTDLPIETIRSLAV